MVWACVCVCVCVCAQRVRATETGDGGKKTSKFGGCEGMRDASTLKRRARVCPPRSQNTLIHMTWIPLIH